MRRPRASPRRPPTDRWWEAYGDPQLDALEVEALQGAPNLKAAKARVRQATATAETARAALLPQFSGEGGIQTIKQSLNEGYPPSFQPFLPAGYHTQTRIAADLDWQLDFFGRNRAALAAATSDAKAAQADAAAARLQLTVVVASAYADLIRLYADRDSALDALRVRHATLQLVGQRLQNGLETRGEFSQQAEFVPAAQASAAQITARDADIARAKAQLASAQSDVDRTALDLKRREALSASGAVSGEELSTARNAYQTAVANLDAVKAAGAQGVANRTVAEGQLASSLALTQGSSLDDNPEVAAAKAAVEVGQPAELTADRYGKGVVFHGRVEGLSGGTGSAMALIPAQNATGNWIKVVQRLPVRIRLDPRELERHPLRVGLSMDVKVDVAGHRAPPPAPGRPGAATASAATDL